MHSSLAGGLGALMVCFTSILALGVTDATAAPEKSGILHVRPSEKHPGMLLMSWKGPTDETMAPKLEAAYDEYRGQITSVYLILNSPGGSVKYGERAIAVLQEIKKTTKLYTGVKAGAQCASMCVFIYVQGEKRFAAPASLWLFHEIAHNDAHHRLIGLDRNGWLRIVDKYWTPAGVNHNWIQRVKMEAVGTDVWKSGAQLLAENENLVQRPLADENSRQIRAPSEHDISDAGKRLAEKLDSFEVEKHWPAGQHINWETGIPTGVPEKTEGKHTHCSAFVASAAKQLGVYILRPPEHGQKLLANAQSEWLASEGPAQGWRRLKDGFEAQNAANSGEFVIASYHNHHDDKPGHIAIVRPSSKGTEAITAEGPDIVQAGEHNFNVVSTKKGFAGHPAAWRDNEIEYYAHSLD